MNYLEFWTSFWAPWVGVSTNPVTKQDDESASGAVPAHEKYEYLTEYGTQILCMLSQENGCSYISRNFTRLTGHDVQKQIGDAFYALVHEDYRDRLKALVADSSIERTPHIFRCKIEHVDGQHFWYQLTLHQKHNGEKSETVCIMDNIHDSMLAQNTLQKARLEAELALRARSEFLANMSHDLRTPLNAVIGFAQIIESEMFGKLQNPQYIEYVKHIQESGHDLLSKIEDLLEIANIDAGRVSIDKQEVVVSEILKQTVDAQMHHAYAARVALQMICPKGDMRLFVDRLKLQHILGHLVSNAIDSCREGGSIVLEATKTAKGTASIIVRDDGKGMKQEKLEAINSALKEENCWTTGTNQDIGLGLALTREFVALHSGQVAVQSTDGQGTAVQIMLPKEAIANPRKTTQLQAVG